MREGASFTFPGDAPSLVSSTGLEPARLSAQALNLPRIPFRHEDSFTSR